MQYSTSEFETLYTQFFPTSMRLAMTLLHEEDDARDVVHEVFVKLWESKIRVENPPAFLIRAVRNACINRLNMLSTHEKVHQRLLLEPPPDDDDYTEQKSEDVRNAISQLLTPREKEIVERIYSDGLTYKQIAETLGISVSYVNKNIVGALRKLRNHFKTGKS